MQVKQNQNLKIYRRSVRASFFLVMFLVLIGGVVRSTGAGMGCPDWPKCFGSWVPPTDASQVPVQYYSDPLSSKNGKLIFNAAKTWTEYVNRLIGVLIGFSLIFQLFCAFVYSAPRKSKIFSLLAFVFVLFEGWLGARVVASDLTPWIISVHMAGAILIGIFLLSALFFVSDSLQYPLHSFPANLTLGILFLIVIQFFLGTEVRGQVDILFKEFDFGMRHLYLERLDLFFVIHRSFSLVLLGLLGFQVFRVGRSLPIQHFHFALFPLLSSVLLILSGAILIYFEFPALAQPLHLVLGFAVICSQFWLFLLGLSKNQFQYAVVGK